MKQFVFPIILAVVISSLTTYFATMMSLQNALDENRAPVTSESTLLEITNQKEIKEQDTGERKLPMTSEAVKVELSCSESCDDGNPCTFEYCNETTDFKCKYTILKGEVEGCKGMVEGSCSKYSCVSGSCTLIYSSVCCGNGKCDSDETYSVCPRDCEQPQTTTTQQTIQTEQNSTTTTKSKENCDPSYPDVCIPPPPPDLDCEDIQFKKFKVLPPDPHRFDGNKNGIGCET